MVELRGRGLKISALITLKRVWSKKSDFSCEYLVELFSLATTHVSSYRIMFAHHF